MANRAAGRPRAKPRGKPRARVRRLSAETVEHLDTANTLLIEAYETLTLCVPPPIALAIATQVLEDMAAGAGGTTWRH